MFNNNFLLGYVLTKDRPRTERILAGLTIGASTNPTVAAVAHKRQTDQIASVERENAGNVQKLKNSITVDVSQIDTNDLILNTGADELAKMKAGKTTLAEILRENKDAALDIVTTHLSKIP